MGSVLENVGKIYDRLMDRRSREIYKSRMMFSLTGDYGEICQIVAMTKQAQMFREQINDHPGCPVYIWGTGFWADYITKGIPELAFHGYVDNVRREDTKAGKPVLSADVFLEGHKDAVVVIATNVWHREIYRQLLEGGCMPERIVNAGSLINELFDEQYFDLPYLVHDEEEVFVDAGCFDGLTVRNFLKWSGGDYKEIFVFEPDRKCYGKCGEALRDVGRLVLEDRGLWSSGRKLTFHETGASDSAVAEKGETVIHAVKLDDYLAGRRITFLKMDIEGAEKEALIGAADTIRRYKPKLAVSIYHKPEDIWEIPLQILDIGPDYKFYLRHYSFRDAETVLYAV